jgi:hypothetical protein
MWLDEAGELLREVASAATQMTKDQFDAQATALVAATLEADLAHDAIAAKLET